MFNLSAPATVNEYAGKFPVMVSMIAPSGGTTFPIKIDIMDYGITATPNGKY